MGTILLSKCNCGFESESLFIGGGMIPMNKEYYLPHYCDDCEYVFDRNILKKSGSELKKYNKCSKCLKKVTSYGSIKKTDLDSDVILIDDIDFRFDLDKRIKLNDKGHYCPRCKSDTLEFEHMGQWD